MIWTMKSLFDECNSCSTEINGNWVPARPENGKKKYATLKSRIKAAWEVFQCRAEAFYWPEGQ